MAVAGLGSGDRRGNEEEEVAGKGRRRKKRSDLPSGPELMVSEAQIDSS